MERNRLARALFAQAAGPMQRIRQSITTNLRIGKSDGSLREQGRLARVEEDSRVRLSKVPVKLYRQHTPYGSD